MQARFVVTISEVAELSAHPGLLENIGCGQLLTAITKYERPLLHAPTCKSANAIHNIRGPSSQTGKAKANAMRSSPLCENW